jgi:uncharacterized protein YycO
MLLLPSPFNVVDPERFIQDWAVQKVQEPYPACWFQPINEIEKKNFVN